MRKAWPSELLIETDLGPVRAGHVISATNAYTDLAQPWRWRRLVPVISNDCDRGNW